MREIEENLATTKLEEDLGMSPGAAEMQQKNITQPARSQGDRRGHFRPGVSQAKSSQGRVWPAEGTAWVKASRQSVAGWRTHQRVDVAGMQAGR